MARQILIYIRLFLLSYIVTSCINTTPPIQEADKLHMVVPIAKNPHGQMLAGTSIDYDYISIIQGVDHTISTMKILFNDINQIEPFALTFADALIRDIDKPQTLFQYAFRLEGATAGGYGPPVSGIAAAGKNRVSDFAGMNSTELQRRFKFKFTENSLDEWRKLPEAFRDNILNTLSTIEKATAILKQFSTPVAKSVGIDESDDIQTIRQLLISPWAEKQMDDFSSIEALSNVDLKKLSYATTIIASDLEKYIQRSHLEIPSDFNRCILKTSFGIIAIYGNKNDTISSDHILIINTGGNDHYSGNTASSGSAKNPIGILIDMAGNDTYKCNDGFLAAGILGLGILLDLDGDDKYISGASGISTSLYGASLLYDAKGDDKYISSSEFSQAASIVGTSILIDKDGDDEYLSIDHSQGYGGTKGTGILIDIKGDDMYGGTITGLPQSSYSKSFVQGASSGRWAEATDGQSLGGGYGFLIDIEGDDKYSAGSFSQGAAYYFAGGFLIDNAGKDEYNALSHSQGYAAHFALGSFFEGGGDDLYNCNTDKTKITQIIGSGRDYSAGIFMDSKGDDTIHYGNRSVGIGDLNGIGVYYNDNGDDVYIWHKNEFNKESPAMGKIIGNDRGMAIDFRLFKPEKNQAKGIFINNMQKSRFITEVN